MPGRCFVTFQLNWLDILKALKAGAHDQWWETTNSHFKGCHVAYCGPLCCRHSTECIVLGSQAGWSVGRACKRLRCSCHSCLHQSDAGDVRKAGSIATNQGIHWAWFKAFRALHLKLQKVHLHVLLHCHDLGHTTTQHTCSQQTAWPQLLLYNAAVCLQLPN
jgi:hypothetical protein